ncbi:MAG: glucose-1-phosphate adenylyltransferase subunit GlgD [Selenomonadaceae bacterium]|nr:glucose-1-phosphate adenylyltransferase subunit GlgD [Selenomonadaceae bacterium]
MKTVMGLINLHEDGSLIRELAEKRAVESIPFGGRLRIIDFTLSGMVNAGILNVGVMLPDQDRSILDHLRSGKDWDLARRRDGMYYIPAVKVDKEARSGDLKNFYYNLDFIEHSKQKYVLLTSGSFIYNVDFNKTLAFHHEHEAEITLAYYTAKEESTGRNAVLKTDDGGRVTDIAEKSVVYDGTKICMGIYFMEKHLFVNLVRHAYERGGQDFLVDAIMRRLNDYKICAYEHQGYVAHIATTGAYYQANMDMLKPEVWGELFLNPQRPIYTKAYDSVPVQYKETAKVKNSLIANGCIIQGEVENSVLFRGVKIGKGAKIKNSIIMQKSEVKEGAVVENSICDKNVTISEGKWLKGAENYPYILEKGAVI